MFDELKKLKENSYSNISNYKVSCIIKMKDGKLFKGVNVENPSFKDGLCAEQVAVGSAVSDGYKKGDFDTVYLLGSSKHSITPCFLCRQLLTEVMDMNTKIISYDEFGKETNYKLSDLCPNTFGSGDLSDK